MVEIVERVLVLVVQFLNLHQEVQERLVGDPVVLYDALLSKHRIYEFELPFHRGFIQNVQGFFI